MLSSYFTVEWESWPGVELGRTIPEGEAIQGSLSAGYDGCPDGRLKSDGKGEFNVDGLNAELELVIPLERAELG
jgi:hypothetical protein